MCWETTFTMPMMGIASSRPHTPQSHPEKSNEINIATAFIFAIWPVIQVTTNMPTKVAIASELPDTTLSSLRERERSRPIRESCAWLREYTQKAVGQYLETWGRIAGDGCRDVIVWRSGMRTPAAG
jgi:hypothetical protein